MEIVFRCEDKMAAKDPSLLHIQTTRELGYISNIVKIPETHSVLQNEHYMLPCVNEYAMMGMFDNPIIIISTIFDTKNLRESVMLHLKRNRRYYAAISATYLNSKKLDYIHWLSAMITKRLPFDEICLHALATLLNIHITVDYIGGFWTTLNLPNINHNLAVALSEVHLVYRGCCKFNLLCRKNLLTTLGRKLLLRKTVHDLPKAIIILNRMDLYNKCVKLPLNNDSTKTDDSESGNMDTDITEDYDYRPDDSKTDYPDSDSTILYEIDEKEVGTIYLVNENFTSRGSLKLSHHLYFHCPYSNCNFKSNRRKITNKHYRQTHKTISRCSLCKKTYSTPYSLTQHLYLHKKRDNRFLCRRCGRTFPFRSQLLIHKIRHSRKYTVECSECSLTFKYRHDMLKHCREHFAKEYQCEDCDYTGTQLKLKSHKKQHDSNMVYICTLCNIQYKYRMALWHHRQRCRRSNSPEY